MAKILVVEDAQDMAQWVARELRACGHDVCVAENGLSALEIHAQQQPHLIVLDWRLPELDGLEVLRRLRQYATTPVLMLTGRDEEVDRVIGLEVGADDYLVKPFAMRELLARVKAMLRRVELIRQTLTAERKIPPAPISYGPFFLDRQTYSASVNGQKLDLSRVEFDLLALMLHHPGQVFERAYLLETVWRESFIDHDRSVDNVIHRLRRKLGDFATAIETVHGIGYRLRATD